MDLGQHLGADFVFDVNVEDPVAAVRHITGGLGADVVVEASGAMPAPQQGGIRIVKRVGEILFLGFYSGTVSSILRLAIRDDVTLYTTRGEGRRRRTPRALARGQWQNPRPRPG